VRIVLSLSIVACSAALAASADSASRVAAPLVSCGNIIGQTSGPRDAGYRPALGVLSVPPASMLRTAVRVSGYGRWTYWFKVGMVIHSGRFVVSVSVPKKWQSRAAITWGGSAIVSTLRFSGCGNSPLVKGWNGYAGGFYLRAPRACIPLVFKRGRGSKTLHFGIGERC
jgi:hypothetical protein